ncbi:MAG: hypothetical protein WCK58_13550 [Chloroflexota bacterium]
MQKLRRIAALALAVPMLIPLSASPVAAASIGIGGSMSEWVPPIVGNNDGWGATVTNTGTTPEIFSASVSRYDATKPGIDGVILSPQNFVLQPGASCLLAVRWIITPEQAANPAGYRGKLNLLARYQTPPATTGTGVVIQTGLGLSKKIAPSKWDSNVIYGNGILSKMQTLCGSSETFTPPTASVSGENTTYYAATKRNMVASPQNTGRPSAVTMLGSFPSNKYGWPDTTSTVTPAVITPQGGGANGWTVPAAGRCIIPATISGLKLGEKTVTMWQSSVPLGSTGGTVYAWSRDTGTGIEKPYSFWTDNGGWVIGPGYPQCAPAN